MRNMNDILRQAQVMQHQIAKLQQDAAVKTFEATSGGGMVTAVVTGKQELKTLTELEKLMGKKAFNEACGQYVMKPEGKPTLVPRSDKRDEISPSDLKSSAAEDFAAPVDDINI
jgi:DNA-binding protein YbaB